MTKVAAIETKGLCIGYLLKGGKRKVVHEDLNLQLVSGEVVHLFFGERQTFFFVVCFQIVNVNNRFRLDRKSVV